MNGNDLALPITASRTTRVLPPVGPECLKVGVVIAHGRSSERDPLLRVAREIVADARKELEHSTGRIWSFGLEEPIQLRSEERRHAGDFLGEASLRLVEGSYDLVVVLIDAPLISRGDHIVFGLASPLARTVVLSTHRLRDGAQGQRVPNDAPQVRWNGAALLLHLIGTTMGARTARTAGGVMAPFAMDLRRDHVPTFESPARIEKLALTFSRRELKVGGPFRELWQHLLSAVRNPSLVAKALVRNRAPLLPLRMPGLATAAVAPVFVLVFSAEFWDAGLGMTNSTAWAYAGISVAAATSYLCFAQRLFLPRKESTTLPEHLAVANVVIFLSMLLAIIGLFAMVAVLVLALSLFVFPSDLISTWPTLENQNVAFPDLLRIAVFISTVGVTTGALAGGMQRRQALRQIALFRSEV